MVFDDDNVNQHFAENEDEENALIATLIFFAIWLTIFGYLFALYGKRQREYWVELFEKQGYPGDYPTQVLVYFFAYINTTAWIIMHCRGDMPYQVSKEIADIIIQRNTQNDEFRINPRPNPNAIALAFTW